VKTLKEIISDLERLEREATPRPFFTVTPRDRFIRNNIIANSGDEYDNPFVVASPNRNMERWEQDLKLLVAARNALPTLLQALRLQDEALEKIESEAEIPLEVCNPGDSGKDMLIKAGAWRRSLDKDTAFVARTSAAKLLGEKS
jgi:hypothetical protein